MALIALHPEVRDYLNNFSDTEYILLFIFFEVKHNQLITAFYSVFINNPLK
jgi:hypothetical protein